MFHRLKELYFETFYRLKRACLLLVGGLLLVSTALMLVGGLLIYRATINWPQTQGQVLKFDVSPLQDHPSHFKVDVAFAYSVDGVDYQGQHLSPMTRPGKVIRWLAQQKQQKYHVGDTVSVIYDPRDPAASYLEPADLFWDVLLVPVSIMAFAAWLLYLFFKMRRRTVPLAVATQAADRFADRVKWRPIMTSVVERDQVILRGFTAYPVYGSLLAGWPACQVALVATPNDFAVVPGPFTKRGVAASLLMMLLEFSLSRFWLPAFHGTWFLFEAWRRVRHWRQIRDGQVEELLANSESIHSVSIDDAVVYGYESRKRRLWYRLPGQKMDEFIRLAEWEDHHADELIAYIGLMQNAEIET